MRRAAALLVACAAWGCSRPQAATPLVAAEGVGLRILRSEVDAKAAGQILHLKLQENETRRAILEDMIYNELLKKEAEARHLTPDALLKAEVQYDQTPPKPEEVQAIYDRYRANLGNRTVQEATPQIVQAILEHRADEARAAFAKKLTEKWGVRIHLPPPRLDVKVPSDAPALGPANAPVTVVEFADYQCPFCQRAESQVETVLEKSGKKVRFVLLDFPLDKHTQALPAAEAAHCAADQGKFFEYRHSLLASPGEFSEEDLVQRADSLKLNLPTFKACLTSKRHEAEVKRSFEEAAALGVSATPTFFVNGLVVEGMVSPERLQELIDAELAGS
jgi:protein-disulfide isomerase